MAGISAVVITYNEERNIGRCLDSLAGVADEIVVVDSFSTDGTEAVCRSRGVRFMQHSFEGYVAQKNYAAGQAGMDYVLSLDADEALSDRLKDSILRIKERPDRDGYEMNRLASYCGRWIRHGGWYPDRKLRLFRRGMGAWGGLDPHDRYLLPEGSSVGFLKGDLLHYTFYTVEEHRLQAERFAGIAAEAMFRKGMRPGPVKRWLSPAALFFRNYFFRLGFMDGHRGWLICTISAAGTYRKYKKLAGLWRQTLTPPPPVGGKGSPVRR